MNGPMSTFGGGAGGGSAEMGDAQTMAAVKNVRSLSFQLTIRPVQNLESRSKLRREKSERLEIEEAE
jgi:hypothetical protein